MIHVEWMGYNESPGKVEQLLVAHRGLLSRVEGDMHRFQPIYRTCSHPSLSVSHLGLNCNHLRFRVLGGNNNHRFQDAITPWPG